MQKYILHLECLLIGYNYDIIRNSSEASAKNVRKLSSAVLLVSLIWAFIGFQFSSRYIGNDWVGSLLVGFILVFVVIQIERQIILSVGKNTSAKVFRTILAIVMSIVGSVIIDQMLFIEDVEKEKIRTIQQEVNDILPSKTFQIESEIGDIDSLLRIKEMERIGVINEISSRPFIKGTKSERKSHKVQILDKNGQLKDTLEYRTDLTITDVTNPSAELLPALEKQIEYLREQMLSKQNAMLSMRNDLELELKSKTGLLDEINILMGILLKKPIALIIWICLFIVFISIELLVLVSKSFDSQNDYDNFILQQMKINNIKISEYAPKE